MPKISPEIFRFLAHCLAPLGRSAAASGTGLLAGRKFPGIFQEEA
ncbi:hypothetical protein OFN66_24160 [Escherichia coli]|nr:hypothetical protein [Escherichia coli]MCV5596828.1 hypothetical protein [Escherichia coli]